MLGFLADSSAQDQECSVPKDKEEARAQGFKRGLKGKKDAAGVTEGWTDDKASGVARTEGWVSGKRKRAQNEAEADKKAKGRS
jgi:hypothetical protein